MNLECFFDYCKISQKHVEPTASHKRILITLSLTACALLSAEQQQWKQLVGWKWGQRLGNRLFYEDEATGGSRNIHESIP